MSLNPDENYSQRVLIEEILLSPNSYIINAPSQFGLTTLGHYLISEAWETNELWVYIDNSLTKPHTIHNAVKNEVISLELDLNDVKCIVFDSFIMNDKVSKKKLNRLVEANPEVKLIILNSVDETLYIDKVEEDGSDDEINLDRNFEDLHLIALPRNQIRKIVNQYNSAKKIGDENSVLDKVISELESLNLHRTPYNVVTILKVSEKNFDDSPVNRTKMIEMILFVLFDFGEIPRYKTKPDLKDCEYVLGRYCEIMLKNEKYTFLKEEFISELKKFCKEKYIDLDIEVVFDVLNNNNILTNCNGHYKFKCSFWIYYFSAKRMHNNDEFKHYILSSKKYSTFPEIIEFYTGIDRNRDDALQILLDDLISTKNTVQAKLGITGNINPLSKAEWKPSEKYIEKVQSEIGENVLSSNLPNVVKDQYLDKNYDQIRPYNQSIQKLFEEYSLVNLIQQVKASSTALRNSDYANVEIKKQLLDEIYQSWMQLAKVLFALSPSIAQQGKVSFEGAAFELIGDFGKTFDERLNKVLQVIPTNIVGYFKDDIYSPKIAPLLFDKFNTEKDEILKHHQALLLIFKRPNGWKKEIENYIIAVKINSYYLFDIVNTLRAKYRYDFASKEELSEIRYLIKLGLAKHEFGDKKPSVKQISKIKDINLPKREFGTGE